MAEQAARPAAEINDEETNEGGQAKLISCIEVSVDYFFPLFFFQQI